MIAEAVTSLGWIFPTEGMELKPKLPFPAAAFFLDLTSLD